MPKSVPRLVLNFRGFRGLCVVGTGLVAMRMVWTVSWEEEDKFGFFNSIKINE